MKYQKKKLKKKKKYWELLSKKAVVKIQYYVKKGIEFIYEKI